MELLLILYLAYAHHVHPHAAQRHYPLQLERTDERVIAWKKSIQKYEKKRIKVGDAEQQALRAVYHDIKVAYTNNQVEAMTHAMACVSNRVDCIQDAVYRELAGGIEDLFCIRFRACKPRSAFDSLADFENFVALHTKMALFLGNHNCKRNDYGFAQTAWIESGTFEVLKKYVEQFHKEGKKDFKAIAKKYLDDWIAHIESPNGFIRRNAHFQMEMSWSLIELGKTTRERARVGALGGTFPLVAHGYTPKWMDEFYNEEELKLKRIYDDIQNAYMSNQGEAMVQAMARVPAHFGRAEVRRQFDSDFILKYLFDKTFLDSGNILQPESLQECKRILVVNTAMALFLCSCDYDETFGREIAPEELKRKFLGALKGYVNHFHHGGKTDFEMVAQKYLDFWIIHSGSTPSLKWLNEFKLL